MNRILHELRQQGLLDEESYTKIAEAETNRLFSVYWHLKTLLYLGVSLLAGGLGLLIYKNIDTIGHLTIVILIGLSSAVSFTYAFLKGTPFSRLKSESPGMFYDYILLLGCLLMLSFLGYLQWQYSVFGTHFGLATFIPSVLLLFSAYRFDHLGVLNLSLVMFASWVGIAITPFDIFTQNDFGSWLMIYTGLGLAILFGTAAFLHRKKEFKSHFAFTYMNFASHLAGLSCLAGLFMMNAWILWGALLAVTVVIIYRYAMTERSFYFLLIAVVYAYIGASYIFTTRCFRWAPEILSVYMIFGFYIVSCLYLIRFLKKVRNDFQKDDLVR